MNVMSFQLCIMPTQLKIGKKIADVDLVSFFRPQDGEITQRFGRIGQGKTYGATADVIDNITNDRVYMVVAFRCDISAAMA